MPVMKKTIVTNETASPETNSTLPKIVGFKVFPLSRNVVHNID